MHKLRKTVIIIVITVLMAGIAVFVDMYNENGTNSPNVALLLPGDLTISPWHNEDDGIDYYFLPSHVDLSDIQLQLSGEKITIADKSFSEGDNLDGLALNQKYSMISHDDKKQTVEFVKSENISSVYVSTATGSMESVYQSKEHKELAKVTVVDCDGNVDVVKTDARIKGRGNSTWVNCKKKPFSIIFNDSEALLGMEASTRWALLANALDYSGIRNALVFDTAKRVGMDTTPDYRFVDLYLNGEYHGLYMLCQPAESFYERVADIDEKDLYLFKSELPERLEDMNYPLYAENGEALIDVSIPQKLDTDEKELAKNITAKLDTVINQGGDDIKDVIDMDSWVKKYLIEEIFENYDAGLASSYFYTMPSESDSKVYAGPIWDYDRVLGNKHCLSGTTKNPEILFAKQEYRGKNQRVLWYSELYSNPIFYNEMVEIFEKDFVPALEILIDEEIPAMSKIISSAKTNDNLRWQIDSSEEYSYMTEYLSKRLNFLEETWLNKKEYVEVTYYTPGVAYDYMRVFVPKGESIASNDEMLERFNKSDKWYVEGTSETYDFNSTVDESITLVNTAQSSTGRIKTLLASMREEIKVIVIIGSIIMLFILLLLYKMSTVYRRGLNGQQRKEIPA